MRARTSLVGHILGSHPEINGYYEMHLGYADAGALQRQLARYQQGETLKPGGRYLFDKLLHNDYVLERERLGPVDIRVLVALREPEQTIGSIVRLFAAKQSAEHYASPLEAANYYIERVTQLAGFCKTAPDSYLYFDADVLSQAPQRLLAALGQWLELGTPLSERYEIFSSTGEARKGDSSEIIRSGRISTHISDYSDIEIPVDALAQARAVYRECREAMIRHAAVAITLDSGAVE